MEKPKKFKIGEAKFITPLVLAALGTAIFISVFLFPLLAELFPNLDPGAIFAAIITFNAAVFFVVLIYQSKKDGGELEVSREKLIFTYNKDKRVEIIPVSEIVKISFIREEKDSGFVRLVHFTIERKNNEKYIFPVLAGSESEIILQLADYNYPI